MIDVVQTIESVASKWLGQKKNATISSQPVSWLEYSNDA